MKLLYEPQNTIEAHMILNLLEQAGLSARIDGEYLQGGMGELQTMGLIRVMVEERDFVAAKSILDEWDANQPEQDAQKQIVQNKSGLGAGVMGFLIGVTAMLVYYNTPVTYEGVDYNGDGKLDETWTYNNHTLSKTELDRNFDGTVDFIYSFDRRGLLESGSSDDDFDGTFETETYYDYGNIVWQKTDTSGDGFKNYRVDFRHGVAEKVSFFDSVTKKVIKIQEFGPLSLDRARVDTNGDGIFDTFYEYDSIEEIANKISN